MDTQGNCLADQAPLIVPEIRTMNVRNQFLFIAFICFAQNLLPTDSLSIAAEPLVEVLVGPMGHKPENGAKSELNTPFAIEFAAGGEMIIVELDGGRIFSWHEKNGLRHLAGAGGSGYLDGAAKQAKFNQLHNLAIQEDGSMLLSDHNNQAVRRYDPVNQTVSTVVGSGERGPAVASSSARDARFNLPICVALTPNKQSLLIADIGNHCIRRWDIENDLVTTVAGNGKSGAPRDGLKAIDAPLVDPRAAIQNEGGEVYVLERGGHALRRISSDGIISTVAGTGKPGRRDGKALESQFDGPKHLCFGPKGVVFVADDNNHAIRRYDPQTSTLTTVDLGHYQIRRPHGVCVHEDWLYIADSYQHRILRVKL
jgi:streptogramin lyase